jgi:hypothetical protein
MNYDKKIIALIFSLLLIAVFTLVGCKPSEAPKQEAAPSNIKQEAAPSQTNQEAATSTIVSKSEDKIRIVNVKKYVETVYKYDFKSPAVGLSIENNSNRPMRAEEFKCTVSFMDIDNKRVIYDYNRHFSNDFTVIEPGYSSSIIKFSISSDSLINTIGNVPINFKIKAKILIWLENYKESAQTAEVIFNPNEYSMLPILEH